MRDLLEGLRTFVACSIVAALFVLSFMGMMAGTWAGQSGRTSDVDDCREWPRTRGAQVVFTFPLGCKFGEWLAKPPIGLK